MMRHIVFLLPALIHFQCFAGQSPTGLEFGPGTDDEQADVSEILEQAEEAAVYGLRVRYIKIEGRWTGPVQMPLATGDLLTPEKISEAMNALREAITAESNQGFGFRSKGEIGVLYIQVHFDTATVPSAVGQPAEADNSVGVVFRPLYLRFSLVEIGNNVLPVPRSGQPTFYEHVPKALLALKPWFTISYDRAFGTALAGSMDVDLLTLASSLRDEGAPSTTDRHLDFRAQAAKSMEELFYRADTELRYYIRHTGETLQEIGVRAAYAGSQEPLGSGEHTSHAVAGGFGAGFRLAPNTRLWADIGYRRTHDRVEETATTKTEADEQVNRLLIEAIPPRIHGFFRAGVWEENGWQTGSGGSYQRLAGQAGYSKEFRVTQSQAIGVEVLAGGGRIWGDPPSHARFFGGNSGGQFLYDNVASPSLLNMPLGPVIRSFGQAEAGFRNGQNVIGGEAYWHVNVNVSLPIPLSGWSRPLIPNELTDLEDRDGNPLTIKQVLNNQVNRSGPNMLAAALSAENPGLSPEAATSQAKRVFREIQPAADFVINDAHVYSIRPLLMFDAAGLSDNGGLQDQWLAAGGGLQVTIVTAKFEAGYMHTFSGPTFGSRGNIFVRLVFQNLF